MSATPKWFTCTPFRFKGDHSFFTRESGLLCRGFQAIGVESKAVMPGPPMDNDQDDIVRAEPADLEDPQWWRSLGLDGVVLYAWGLPKYTKIASAITGAGVFLVSSIDASGLMSPYIAGPEYARALFSGRIAQHGMLLGPLLAAAALARSLVPRCFDLKRLEHLKHADRVTMVTPQAVEIMKALALRFGMPEVAARTSYMPHPQLPCFKYAGTPKENRVVSVGRWEKSAWHQKNPQLLVKSLGRFLERRSDYRATIVGNGVEALRSLFNPLAPQVADRIRLIPFLPPEELLDIYLKSKIGFWTSRSEGQQGTGAQALCCGCSVVATAGVAMNCFAHYVSRGSGRQAVRNDAGFVADALLMEAAAWDDGERDPALISHSWTREFHHSNVARRYLRFGDEPPAVPNGAGLDEPDLGSDQRGPSV